MNVTATLASIGIDADQRAISLMATWHACNDTRLPASPWQVYDVYRVFARLARTR